MPRGVEPGSPLAPPEKASSPQKTSKAPLLGPGCEGLRFGSSSAGYSKPVGIVVKWVPGPRLEHSLNMSAVGGLTAPAIQGILLSDRRQCLFISESRLSRVQLTVGIVMVSMNTCLTASQLLEVCQTMRGRSGGYLCWGLRLVPG